MADKIARHQGRKNGNSYLHRVRRRGGGEPAENSTAIEGWADIRRLDVKGDNLEIGWGSVGFG